MGLFSGILKGAGAAIGAVTGNPWIGAAASALAGGMDQDATNRMNVNLSRDQMEFQERMSNTAHQREVADLEAAGLNPMLSARYGGASTPPGASAVVQNSGASADASALSAAQVRLVNAQTKAAEAQASVSSAQAAKTVAETPGAVAVSGMAEIDHELAKFFRDRGDNRWLAEKKMDADGAEAILRKYVANMSENERQTMDKQARARGFESWQHMVADKDYQRSVIDMALHSSQIPKAEAEAAFYRTDFGKEVAPYISSAQGITSVAAGAAGVGRRFGIGLRR